MPDVPAVSVYPTCTVPEMTGNPVGAWFCTLAATTGPLATLVTDSTSPTLSVKLTVSLIRFPCSAAVSV